MNKKHMKMGGGAVTKRYGVYDLWDARPDQASKIKLTVRTLPYHRTLLLLHQQPTTNNQQSKKKPKRAKDS
jgi:hypothetical protein